MSSPPPEVIVVAVVVVVVVVVVFFVHIPIYFIHLIRSCSCHHFMISAFSCIAFPVCEQRNWDDDSDGERGLWGALFLFVGRRGCL